MIVHKGMYKELELNIDWSNITAENPLPAWTPLTATGEIVGDSDAIYALLPMAFESEPLFPRAYVLVSGTLEAEDEDDMAVIAELATNAGEVIGMDTSLDTKPAFFYFTPPELVVTSDDDNT